MKQSWVLFVIMVVCVQGMRAQKRYNFVGIGTTNQLDTYLSPEKYTGPELRYLSMRVKPLKDIRWERELKSEGQLALTQYRGGNGREMSGLYTFSLQWLRTMLGQADDGVGQARLSLSAGLGADAHLGFIYNTRNGNNPAQAKAALHITPAAVLKYHFKINSQPHTLRYELNVPLLGVMFSPQFGQSYYEIFTQGNYDHNIQPTWVGNAPCLRQMLTCDVRLFRHTFLVGYLGDFQQAKVNSLKYHSYTHALVIGWRY